MKVRLRNFRASTPFSCEIDSWKVLPSFASSHSASSSRCLTHEAYSSVAAFTSSFSAGGSLFALNFTLRYPAVRSAAYFETFLMALMYLPEKRAAYSGSILITDFCTHLRLYLAARVAP